MQNSLRIMKLTFASATFLLPCLVTCAVAASSSVTTAHYEDQPERKLLRRAAEKSRHLASRDDTTPCHTIGEYETGISLSGNMLCYSPINDTDNLTFPLLSFAHGYGGGGPSLMAYHRMFADIASSGFVICAYSNCWTMCPKEWPRHQLDIITRAKALVAPDDDRRRRNYTRSLQLLHPLPILTPETPQAPEALRLPIRKEADVGVIGYSSGGVSTLMSTYKEYVLNYSIGSAVTYDGDGASYANKNYGIRVSLENVEPSLPLFLVASTEIDKVLGVPPQCEDHAKPNEQSLLSSNPDRPLLTACIDGMDHLDNVDIPFLHKGPLLAAPYVVAFFGYTLDPSSKCNGNYEDILGDQLLNVSSVHYHRNNLF